MALKCNGMQYTIDGIGVAGPVDRTARAQRAPSSELRAPARAACVRRAATSGESLTGVSSAPAQAIRHAPRGQGGAAMMGDGRAGS
jgi:hypothetical protein